MAVPAAKGLTVFKGGTKVAAKDTVKDLIKNEVATVVKGKARKEVVARFGAVAVNKYSVRLAAKQFLVEAVRAIQKTLTRGKLEVSVNVTGFVRFVNQRIGRDPFRRLFGLDPQILLASDGRVYLKLVWSKTVIDKRQRALLAVRKFVEQLNNARSSRPEPSPGHTAGHQERAPKVEPPRAEPKPLVSETQAGVLWLMALADILPEGSSTDRPQP